jgi:pimeloyl-ACP methyl ester carboxylesterase
VRSTAITPTLEIAYDQHGSGGGTPVVLSHGFPYDVHAFDDVARQLATDGCRVIVPYLRGYGPTRFTDAGTMRSGQQGALGADLLALLNALEIESAVLGGYDWGGRASCVVAALWPERCHGLVTVGGYNIQHIAGAHRPLPPEVEHRLWYQYYLHGERGRAGLERNRAEFARLLWRQWSPTWVFDEVTFGATAESFDNPDFVDVVTHSYRHRFGLVAGDPAYDHIEADLACRPVIGVPTAVLLGGDDGVDPPAAGAADTTEVRGFAGVVTVAVVAGAGHNLPQEAPHAFAAAVLALR